MKLTVTTYRYHVLLVFRRALHLDLGAMKCTIVFIPRHYYLFRFFNIAWLFTIKYYFVQIACFIGSVKSKVVSIFQRVVFHALVFLQHTYHVVGLAGLL